MVASILPHDRTPPRYTWVHFCLFIGTCVVWCVVCLICHMVSGWKVFAPHHHSVHTRWAPRWFNPSLWRRCGQLLFILPPDILLFGLVGNSIILKNGCWLDHKRVLSETIDQTTPAKNHLHRDQMKLLIGQKLSTLRALVCARHWSFWTF